MKHARTGEDRLGFRGTQVPFYAIAAVVLGLLLRFYPIASAPVHGAAGLLPAYNDEASHLNHIALLASTDRPGQQRMAVHDPDALIRGEVEYYQPPLYYMFASQIAGLFGTGWRGIIALRVVSLLLWVAAVGVVAFHAPSREMRGALLLAGGLLGAGFIPSVTLTNDALFALIVAGLYAMATRAAHGPLGLLGLMNLALLAAAAIWTKLSGLVLLPMVAAAAWMAGDRRTGAARTVIVLLVTLWATLPLGLQRIALYGSPLSITDVAAPQGALDIPGMIKAALYSTLMPWMELWASPWVKVALVLFGLALLASLVLGILRRRAILASLTDTSSRGAALLWTIGGVGSLLGWLYYALRYQQAEARLLLPAAPTLAVAFGWPLWAGPGRWRNAVGWALVILFALPFLAWGRF